MDFPLPPGFKFYIHTFKVAVQYLNTKLIKLMFCNFINNFKSNMKQKMIEYKPFTYDLSCEYILKKKCMNEKLIQELYNEVNRCIDITINTEVREIEYKSNMYRQEFQIYPRSIFKFEVFPQGDNDTTSNRNISEFHIVEKLVAIHFDIKRKIYSGFYKVKSRFSTTINNIEHGKALWYIIGDMNINEIINNEIIRQIIHKFHNIGMECFSQQLMIHGNSLSTMPHPNCIFNKLSFTLVL